ncbi:permease [Lederbergia sp. NSJ-179]|uniref:permease n=1 Tax=Lederbergia sp. NSJ-179 TaxID=2931402 RepID=UPI001FD3F04D|nr:permease [Lederbergia sp. NSJ-179]MCJ7840955.1 permease [Lederbergia sp. NSJ-179]
MNRLYSYSLDVTGMFVIMIVFFFISTSQLIGKTFSMHIPNSLQQLNTIFLSILIEAIPFVLIGVLIAGFVQIFVTEEFIRKWIPKNRYMAVLMSCVIGGLFPACECGIVPIVRRLASKGVPIHAAVGFLLTGPLINPIVIFSTYMAFGNDLRMAILRMGVGFIAALFISLAISYLYKSNQLKDTALNHTPPISKAARKKSFYQKLGEMMNHSIDEFFDMGKYLFIGAFIAAFVQTNVATSSLFVFGDGVIGSTIMMMILAFLLSLCSEADAFIGASFSHFFPSASVLAFLVYGPMLDLKNAIMLWGAFRARFVLVLSVIITLVVFLCIRIISLLGW